MCYFFAMDNEIPDSKPHFTLYLVSIAETRLNDTYCALIINTINNHKNFNFSKAHHCTTQIKCSELMTIKSSFPCVCNQE